MKSAMSSAGGSARAQVSGGGPGYSETAKMLAEAALCLVFDDTRPRPALTAAQAMGEALMTHLVATGLKFEVFG